MRHNYSRRIGFETLEPRCMMAVIAGDYDVSGVVDNADFNLWRAEFGTIIESPADGNGNGVVDAADYTLWRDNKGKTLGLVTN